MPAVCLIVNYVGYLPRLNPGGKPRLILHGVDHIHVIACVVWLVRLCSNSGSC